MRPLLPAAIVVALLLAGCSSPEKDPETGFPRVPPTATHFSLLKSEGGKARYYQADHTPGEPAIVFRADRVDEEHWHLMRFERDGEKTRPEESDLQRISLLLDAVIVFPIPEGEYPGAPHEHPLRAQFREIASGKKPAKWSALLPVILSDECPSPRARSRFVLILVKRADDPEKLCPVLRENLAKLELVSDDDWKAFGIEALATRKDGVALVGLAVAQACTFDDAKLAILRAVLDLKALTEPEQLELVKVASAVSSDQGKAEVMSALARRTDLFPGVAVAIVDATRPIASSSEAASILCAVIAHGEIPQVLSDHLEPAIDRLPSAPERERCWKALDRARRKP